MNILEKCKSCLLQICCSIPCFKITKNRAIKMLETEQGLKHLQNYYSRHRKIGEFILQNNVRVFINIIGNIFWVYTQSDGTKIEKILYHTGSIEWKKNGLTHRDDDEPSRIDKDSKFWFQDGHYHRTNGPAHIYDDGSLSWWVNGRLIKWNKQYQISHQNTVDAWTKKKHQY